MELAEYECLNEQAAVKFRNLSPLCPFRITSLVPTGLYKIGMIFIVVSCATLLIWLFCSTTVFLEDKVNKARVSCVKDYLSLASMANISLGDKIDGL